MEAQRTQRFIHTQPMITEQYNQLSERMIACCIAVHKELVPGLLERVYETTLALAFKHTGIKFSRQVHLPVFYKGIEIDQHVRKDMVAEDAIIVELKVSEFALPVHEVILVTYLKLANKNLVYSLISSKIN